MRKQESPYFAGVETIDPEYRTESLTVELAGERFELLRVTNTDELYEKLVAKGKNHSDVIDERIPYWADLWPSALGLATEVLTNPMVSKGTRVLEIGCGMGLPGIAAGRKGALVTMTDYVPEPLSFTRFNWKKNLDSAGSFGLLDWRTPEPAYAAEVLLASDVAYEKRSFDALIQAFRTLVLPGGIILLSEPNRQTGVEFFRELPEQGFVYSRKSLSVPLNGRINEVSVYEIRDKSHTDL